MICLSKTGGKSLSTKCLSHNKPTKSVLKHTTLFVFYSAIVANKVTLYLYMLLDLASTHGNSGKEVFRKMFWAEF